MWTPESTHPFHAPCCEVANRLQRRAVVWESLGESVRPTLGQAGCKAQPEAGARGPPRKLAEVQRPRIEVELALCTLRVLRQDLVFPQLRAVHAPHCLRCMAAEPVKLVDLGALCIQAVEQQQEGAPELKRRLLERAGDVHFFEAHIDHSLRHGALILRRQRRRQLARAAVPRRRVLGSVSPLGAHTFLLRTERRNEAPEPGRSAARLLLAVPHDAVRDWRHTHRRQHRPHVSKLPVSRLPPFACQGHGSQVPLVLGQQRSSRKPTTLQELGKHCIRLAFIIGSGRELAGQANGKEILQGR